MGYDDDQQLDISGGGSALPLWTEFMKRTTDLPGYQKLHPFSLAPGIVTASIDMGTNLVALADAAMTRPEVFIEGTEPFPPKQEEQPEATAGTENRTLPDPQ